jgi:hypothetical protein
LRVAGIQRPGSRARVMKAVLYIEEKSQVVDLKLQMLETMF